MKPRTRAATRGSTMRLIDRVEQLESQRDSALAEIRELTAQRDALLKAVAIIHKGTLGIPSATIQLIHGHTLEALTTIGIDPEDDES